MVSDIAFYIVLGLLIAIICFFIYTMYKDKNAIYRTIDG